MGFITDILKDIPVNAVLRSKIKELGKKYEEIEAENTQLKDENQKLKSKVKELTNGGELCENEVKILQLLSSTTRRLTAATIAGELSLSFTKTDYYLGKMRRKYVNSADWSNNRASEYYLTQKGREYLVENDLVE